MYCTPACQQVDMLQPVSSWSLACCASVAASPCKCALLVGTYALMPWTEPMSARIRGPSMPLMVYTSCRLARSCYWQRGAR